MSDLKTELQIARSTLAYWVSRATPLLLRERVGRANEAEACKHKIAYWVGEIERIEAEVAAQSPPHIP